MRATEEKSRYESFDEKNEKCCSQKGERKTNQREWKNTWLAYDFENNDRQYCFADFLVLTIGRENFQTQNVKTGKNVIIELVKPDFFFEYQRLELVNPKKSSFDGNTHKATFFKRRWGQWVKSCVIKKRWDCWRRFGNSTVL